jgi:hypothetical protein
MVDLYVILIGKGLKTIEEVPLRIRQAVADKLLTQTQNNLQIIEQEITNRPVDDYDDTKPQSVRVEPVKEKK